MQVQKARESYWARITSPDMSGLHKYNYLSGMIFRRYYSPGDLCVRPSRQNETTTATAVGAERHSSRRQKSVKIWRYSVARIEVLRYVERNLTLQGG